MILLSQNTFAMKILRLSALVVTCCLILAVQAFAKENPKDSRAILKDKVVKLIDNPDISDLEGDLFEAEIEFLVTSRNRIVVLGVNTHEEFFDTYIKEKLNYNKVRVKGVAYMQPYRIKVTFHRDDYVPIREIAWR
jgi:hypothetical protein